ncbi:hypothetical protein ACUUL3_11465 [Thiovibrio sp. JS02]
MPRTGKRAYLCVLAAVVVVVALLAAPAFAQERAITLAVMPIEDLSMGANGYNLPMTRSLAAKLREKGISVLAEADLIDFMVRNRIRWLGFLDSQNVVRLKEDMACDFILLGSVNQAREENPPALGASLQLVRTADAKIIWAGSSELCKADMQRLLDLAEPQTLQDVEELVVGKLLAAMPGDLIGGLAQVTPRVLDLVQLRPEVVKPGEPVVCRVRLVGDRGADSRGEVTLQVGDLKVVAEYKTDEHLYEAVWQATGSDGRYPVMLNLADPAGGQSEIFVGSYLVDGSAPRLRLQVNAPQLHDVAVLRDRVAIVPVVLDPEPILRWEISIADLDGNVLMVEQGRSLPDRLVWRGQARDGMQLPDGFYDVFFTAWDRAANKVTVSDRLQILRRAPNLDIAVEQEQEELIVDLRHDDEVPLAYWRIEIHDKAGGLVHEESGNSLPAKLNVPLAAQQEKGLRFVLFARDILGNKVRRTINNPLRSAAGKVEQEPEVVVSGLAPEDF